MDFEYNNQTMASEIIEYIDNLDFSNTTESSQAIEPVNRNITKDIISTYFSRFRSEKTVSKMKLKVFNKKIEKIYNIMLGTILRYIKYIPNTVKNTNDQYVIYDDMKKLTFFNVIGNTMLYSKYIHDNMIDLFVSNKNKRVKTNILSSQPQYTNFFNTMLVDVLKVSDFKIDETLLDKDNFSMSINSMLKLISTYCIKNNIYVKNTYPYNINGLVYYRDIKTIQFSKLPDHSVLFDKIYELINQKNENILKTFILSIKEQNKNIVFIPKSYYNNNKIIFTYIELVSNDNIITSEAKLDISKLKDQISNIYIKIFGFSTILRFITSKDQTITNEGLVNKIGKIIEKTQEKLKST